MREAPAINGMGNGIMSGMMSIKESLKREIDIDKRKLLQRRFDELKSDLCKYKQRKEW